MSVRRGLFAVLNLGTWGGLIALLAAALAPGGLTGLDILMLVLFALWLPWFVIGFWNAVIGFILMRFTPDAVAAVIPHVKFVLGDEPIATSTAIAICIRNEPPARVARNLVPLLEDLVASGEAGRFHLYILSDTSDPQIAAAEATLFGGMAKDWDERIKVTYRLREVNTGFKAGNIRDFCERWGKNHDFVITLDADSIITATAALRMVRIMQIDPQLGILQALVIGLPSTSAFARLFQFGMRLGMRSFTLGSAWWQGDCGPYWGHNAIIRLKPFTEHCELPVLPGRGLLGGHILSHDQVEAVLMRRAGYDVRVLPEEDLGWEENPPTLTEFMRRDVRWCQGNTQYIRLVGMPGIKPVSRFQISFAILMYFGSPIWLTFVLLGASLVAKGMTVDMGYAWTFFAIIFALLFAPKLATAADVLLTPEQRARYGGGWRFVASLALELIFNTLLISLMAVVHTAFLIRLLSGRSITWMAQSRDGHEVPLSDAVRYFLPQTIIGVAAIGAVWNTPELLPFALFGALGMALAIPFAVVTASQAFGEWCIRRGICKLPEEFAPPPIFSALKVPAIEAARLDAPADSAASHAR